MSKQSEALKLADLLCGIDVGGSKNAWLNKAAAELRRLHAVNAELLEALEAAQSFIGLISPFDGEVCRMVRKAIDKAEGGEA